MAGSLTPQELEDDSFKSYNFGIAVLHEIAVRRHNIIPRDAIEQAWWDEGFTNFAAIARRRRSGSHPDPAERQK